MRVESHFNNIESVLESFEGTYTISADISYLSLGAMVLDTPVLHQSNNKPKKKSKDEYIYCTVAP